MNNQDIDIQDDIEVSECRGRYNYTKYMNEKRNAGFDPLRTGIDTSASEEEE